MDSKQLFLFLTIFSYLSTSKSLKAYLPIKSVLNQSIECSYMIKHTKVEPIFIPNIVLSIEVEFFDYEKLDKIDLKCFDQQKLEIISLIFFPKKPVILSNELNLDSDLYSELGLTIKFLFYKGIVSQLNIFETIVTRKSSFFIYFFYSNFGLEDNQNRICDIVNNTIFKKVTILHFSLTTRYVPSTCPTFFYKCDISKLVLRGLSSTLIKNNYLSFRSVSFDLDSSIQNLEVFLYETKIGRKILCSNIFHKLEILNINGKLSQIDLDALTNFTLLKKINFEISNYDVFVGKSFQWLNSLKNKSDASNLQIYIRDYNYPNNDLCYFKNLDQNRKFLFDFTITECSCTIFWLYKIYYYQEGLMLLEQKCNNFNLLNLTCNFDFSFCNISLKISYKTTLIDKFYQSEYLNLITLFVSPFFVLISLITNLINIFVLMSFSKESKSDHLMKNIMLINSVINFLFSFIYIFHLANICVGYHGIFCPYFSKWVLVQLYEICVVDFFGGILKTVSNFLVVIISLNRYFLLRNDRSLNLLAKFTSNIKKVIVIVVIAAVLINLDKLLTSVVIDDNFTTDNYELYEEFPKRNTFITSFEKDTHHFFARFVSRSKTKRWFYFVLFCINFVLNDFLLFVALCVSDLLLLHKFKENIKIKKTIRKKNNLKNKKKNSFLRITVIVIISINILVVLRSLEFFLNIFMFKLKIYESSCDKINKICTNIYQAGNFLYLISCSYTTIIYYYLNNLFREQFKMKLQILFYFKKKIIK